MFKTMILANLLLLFWGNSVLRLLWPQGRRSIWIYVPVAYYLGECCVMVWMYVLAIFGIHFSVLTIDLPISMMALLSYFFREHSFKFGISNPAGNEKWGMLKTGLVVVVTLYIAWQIFYVMWMAASVPVFEWDVVWRIGLKARCFFFDQGLADLKNLPYPGYALGGPFMMCWASLQAGIWSEEVLRSIPAFEFLMFIGLFYGFLSVLLSRFGAILGTGLLVSSGFFTYHATLLYNDFSVSVLFCSSVFCLVLWNRSKDNRLLLVASLLMGGAGLFKLESFVYVFLIILTWPFFFALKNSKTVMIFFVPVMLVLICHEILYWNLHVSSNGINIGFLGMPGIADRMLKTLTTFGKQFFGSWNWNVLWGFFLALWVSDLKCIRDHEELRVLILYLGLFISYLILASILTDKFWILGGPDSYQTLPRMVLHFYPLCPAAIVLLLKASKMKFVANAL